MRVCREGEAWAIAGGLYLGGARPVVMIQCTGLFESGDALRNVLFDYRIPLFSLIGYRSYLSQTAIPNDSARTFTEPILKAWGIDYRLIDVPEKKAEIVEHYRHCQSAGRPGCRADRGRQRIVRPRMPLPNVTTKRMTLIEALEVLHAVRRGEVVVTTMGNAREWQKLGKDCST